MTRSQLESLLARRYGWQLASHGHEALDRAIRQRLLWFEIEQGGSVGSESAYLAQLQEQSGEFQALLEELVVPESWFFREREALRETARLLLARHLQNPRATFRLLSAPCSRGEEPISLAVSLLEAGLPEGSFHIDAVDISALALEHARTGIYTSFSFRGTEASFRDAVFEPLQPRGWRVRDRYRNCINYRRHNLLELPEFFRDYDVIFCRNLLIYLTQDARLRMFENFHRMLLPDGLLLLAACEFALPPQSLFSSGNHQGALVFRKCFGEPVSPFRADPTAARPRSRPPLLPDPNPKPPLQRGLAAQRLQRLSVEARRVGESSHQQSLLLETARIAADQGRLDECNDLCRSVLEKGPVSQAYFLMSLVCSARNLQDQAEVHLRRALYLDPEHKDALAQLALIREMAGDYEASRRLRERLKR